MDAIIVYSTCPDIETARSISRELVQEKLAACVSQVQNVTSVYQWQNKIEQDDEVLLIIKTTNECYAALEKTLTRLHPYELPELIAVPVCQGLPGYLDWIQQCTTQK